MAIEPLEWATSPPRASSVNWRWPSTPWPTPSLSRMGRDERLSPTSPTSCALRSPSSGEHSKPWPTAPGQLLSTRDDVLRLQRIVEDLETLAAADAAGLGLETAPVDLASIAAGSAATLNQQFLAAEIRVETKLEPAIISGDSARLHQVVANLLTNALKFTPAGGRVEVRVHPDGNQAVLDVIDTGIGIPADELPHVFDRFWRGAEAQNVAGNGVGLTVVAELVRAHGGRASVESEPGRGSRF